MTIRQKQWQLYFLGYLYDPELPIERLVDGIWGPKSIAATIAFQKDAGIKTDGIFGASTQNKSMEMVDAIQDIVSKYAPSPLAPQYWGLAGAKTMAATTRYQKTVGLIPTGIADTATRERIQTLDAPEPGAVPGGNMEPGGFWEEIRYFTREELKCKCGGKYCDGFPAEPQELLVRLADRARANFGLPARNVSCLRCRTHNANSGGVANSQHMYGEAMDICIPGISGDRLLGFFRSQPEIRYAYKINATNVHFDIPKGRR